MSRCNFTDCCQPTPETCADVGVSNERWGDDCSVGAVDKRHSEWEFVTAKEKLTKECRNAYVGCTFEECCQKKSEPTCGKEAHHWNKKCTSPSPGGAVPLQKSKGTFFPKPNPKDIKCKALPCTFEECCQPSKCDFGEFGRQSAVRWQQLWHYIRQFWLRLRHCGRLGSG